MQPSRVLVFGLCVFAGAAHAQTSILTLTPSGAQADGGSLYPEITPDGRFIAYQSGATNLVSGDTNAEADVFLHDRILGTTVRVSIGHLGQEGDQGGLEPAISFDGNVVAYFSYSTNLVPNDSNGAPDVFVRDVAAGTTTRVSVSSAGVEASGGCRYAALSGDGLLVTFESKAANLVAGDTNGVRDVFLHERVTGATTRVSVDVNGVEGDGDSLDSSLSPDGRWVAFESTATNLVGGDANGMQDIFVKDLLTGAIVRASVDSAGVEADLACGDPTLSDLGRFVTFNGEATNLVPGDTNNVDDVFLRDLVNGTTTLVSDPNSSHQSYDDSYDSVITPDGRYVVYYSASSTLVFNDNNDVEDIFLFDTQTATTERVSLGSAGQEGNARCLYPAISGDGRLIAFDSDASNFVLADLNADRDIFLYDRSSPFELFCFADGTLAPCPCGNNGDAYHGCENSADTGGATLEVAGTISPDTVRFTVTGTLPSVFCVLIQGDGNLGTPTPFGDGLRCLGGALKRLYVLNAINGGFLVPGPGDPSVSARSAALGDPLTPGTTRFYQVYYRDPVDTFCPNATFNLSNAVRIDW